jgi:hypothetical protein
MLSKNDIIEKAYECGFGDIGFTTAFCNNDDERVLGMVAWAIGRIGGSKAKKALNDILPGSESLVREEILSALEKF